MGFDFSSLAKEYATTAGDKRRARRMGEGVYDLILTAFSKFELRSGEEALKADFLVEKTTSDKHEEGAFVEAAFFVEGKDGEKGRKKLQAFIKALLDIDDLKDVAEQTAAMAKEPTRAQGVRIRCTGIQYPVGVGLEWTHVKQTDAQITEGRELVQSKL